MYTGSGAGGTLAPEATREVVAYEPFGTVYDGQSDNERHGRRYEALYQDRTPPGDRQPGEPSQSSPHPPHEVVPQIGAARNGGRFGVAAGLAILARPEPTRDPANFALRVLQVTFQDGRPTGDDHGGQRRAEQGARDPEA